MFAEYSFARSCAFAWLRMQNIPCDETTGPRRLAFKLGRVTMKGSIDEAKAWIIEWHNKALETNKPAAGPDDGKAFYASQQWRSLRYKALKRGGGRCDLCGAVPSKDQPLHVDHIRPRSKFPALALELSNLQVLCKDCNLGKSNRDDTDWRKARRVKGSEAKLGPKNPFSEERMLGYSEEHIGRELRSILRS